MREEPMLVGQNMSDEMLGEKEQTSGRIITAANELKAQNERLRMMTAQVHTIASRLAGPIPEGEGLNAVAGPISGTLNNLENEVIEGSRALDELYDAIDRLTDL